MKNKIKQWLGIIDVDNINSLQKRISSLEKEIGEEKEEGISDYLFWSGFSIFGDSPKVNSLHSRIKSVRDDFNELDKKFDSLERYLQIEYYKEDKETQVYDWADKNHSEGFRKCKKTYEQMKKDKKSKDNDD